MLSRVLFFRWIALSLCSGAVVSGCSRRAATDERRFTLQGQVIAVSANHLEATIRHEDIKDFMPAMTMPYKVRDAALLGGIEAGDLITAVLVVVSNDAFLGEVRKVGHAPLGRATVDRAPSAGSENQVTPPAIPLLQPGDTVPDAQFVDQDGRQRDFDSFTGAAVVLTFTYTRCPMPTFCPLMDRHFAAIQKKLKQEGALGRRVHLVTVTFDTEIDSPPVLKKHAQTLDADPRIWTFLTGTRVEIDRFATRFGLSVVRSESDPRDMTHTLRTAIIDGGGRLVKVYTGNAWTPEQVLGDLEPVVRSAE